MSSYLGFTPTKDPNYYFVSYNNEDCDRVGTIASALAKQGVPLWYDYGLPYGEKWAPMIAEKIDHSKAVILFFTKGILSKQSSFVQKEYKMAAHAYRKKIYVVLMDQIDHPDVPYDKMAWWLDIQELQCFKTYSFSSTDSLVKSIMQGIRITPNAKEAAPAKAEQTQRTPIILKEDFTDAIRMIEEDVNRSDPVKPDKKQTKRFYSSAEEEIQQELRRIDADTEKKNAENRKRLHRTQAEMMGKEKEEKDDSVDLFGVKYEKDIFHSFVESWLNLNEKKNDE